MELVELQRELAEFEARDVRLVAVAVDPPDKLTMMRDAAGASFPFLSDPDGELIDLLGVRHVGAGPEGNDLPQSSRFLVEPDGTVAWHHLAPNYRVRPTPEEVLAAVDGAS